MKREPKGSTAGAMKSTHSSINVRRDVFSLQLEVDTEEGLGGEKDEFSLIQLSVCALNGVNNPKVMRLTRMCGKMSIFILIDSGSTHNFVSEKTTSKLGCILKLVEETKVRVASGDELPCKYKCEGFEWKIQGHNFITDVYLLLLDSYDLILGTQ